VARLTEILEVPTDRELAFDHIADFTTTAAWDPSIAASDRLDSGRLGEGSRFRVRLRLGPVTVPLVYEITTYDRPDRVVLTTIGATHRGEDDVRLEPTGTGTRVIWRAMFQLRGPGKLIDPVLGVGFRGVGKAAVAGLETSLLELAGR
jgi:dehydrogenase/reductase SDR family member 12